ncbi:helix-turn-helix transcriptional regulator [Pseudomonas nitroreducens]|uniref:helix-turn-helix transcriptional regulator n=1 Tax=Pseudomonas nitroreducens TaxID=46680 RepID=UPI002FE285A3
MNATLLPSEDILVRETLSFSRQLLGVSGALFYWIDNSRQEMQVLDTLGVPTGFLEQYTHGMQSLDPMGVRRMLERHESVGVLSMAPAVQSLNDMRHYHGYLHSFGIIDTIDLMFWGGESAYGGIGLLRTLTDPPPSMELPALGTFQRFLEASFDRHPHVRQIQRDLRLQHSGLSHRERQAALLIGTGASNQEVADAMGITLATAKTYVVRIFEKLGVESRTALAAYLSKLS